MGRNVIFLIVVLLSISTLLKGQYESVEWYHQEDGLPNDLVKSFAIDSAGFVWVATDDGLVKIEGRNILNVSTPKLFSNNFKNVLLSKKYGLIASADAGLLKIDQRFDGIFSNFFDQESGISNFTEFKYPKTLYEALDTSIWIADLQKVYRINNNQITTFNFPQKCYTDHFSRSYQFFEFDRTHFFALSQTGFLFELNKQKTGFVEVPWNYIGTQIYCVERLNNHSFLVGCEAGLLIIEFDNNGSIKEVKNLNFEHPVSVIKPLNNKKYIFGTWSFGANVLTFEGEKFSCKFLEYSENQIINDILIDKQDQIWLGTDLGLLMYRNVAFQEPYKNLTQRYIQEIQKGLQNITYFSDGLSVYKVDEALNASIFFTPSSGLIIALATDDNGVLMGTNNGMLYYKKYSGELTTTDFSIEGHGIYNAVIDFEANKWIIQARTDKETLLKIDTKGVVTDMTPHLEKNERIRSLILSPKGELYIGATGANNYLFKYNYKKRMVENLSLPVDVAYNDLMSVIDIAFADSGKLFLATKFGLWHLKDSTIVQIDLGAMTNEMITALAIDKNKGIWLANSNGIINYHNEQITIYDNADGLPAKTTNYRCLAIDSNNNLWVGTISGLAIGKIELDEIKTPKPIISMLEKSGMLISINQINRFVEKSLLNFTFATPVYPAKYVKYQYSLSKNGVFTHWVDLAGYKDYVILNNLKKGDYELWIRAKNKGNYGWSEATQYKFSIYKTWYTRAGILAIVYLSFFLLVWLYIYLVRIRNIKEKKKLEKIIEYRTIDLRDQNEELKTLNANLQIAKEESEAAIKTKDRFFSILAHDLKSPFNTLIGFSQLLVHNRNEISEESMEQLFSEMLKISENTYNLLQNLLEWAMSQTGALKIDKKCLVFSDLLRDILPTLENVAKQKGIAIKLDLQDSLVIFADEALIATVLRNLISNAIKFSHNNSSIYILGRVMEGFTEISVVDSGIGIPNEKLDQLFMIDVNVSTLGTANEIGTGLGLVLCNEFIKKSNGTITVESQLGIGTKFIVKLPLA